MYKTMLAIAASLAMLVTTSGGAKAAFTVTVQIDGGAPQPLVDPGGTNNPSNPNSSIFGSTFAGSQVFNVGGGTITIDVATTATETTGSFSRLSTSTLSISNNSGASRNIVVTIAQNAFQFPNNTVTFNSPLRFVGNAGDGGVTITSGSVTSTAGLLTPYNNTLSTSTGFQNFANNTVMGTGSAGFSSITQVLTLNGLANNSNTTFRDDSLVSLATPLPPTGLMAAVAFPLLGLAGAFRRRVLG